MQRLVGGSGMPVITCSATLKVLLRDPSRILVGRHAEAEPMLASGPCMQVAFRLYGDRVKVWSTVNEVRRRKQALIARKSACLSRPHPACPAKRTGCSVLGSGDPPPVLCRSPLLL